MPSARDLKNAKRLERLKARKLARDAQSAPEATGGAPAGLPAAAITSTQSAGVTFSISQPETWTVSTAVDVVLEAPVPEPEPVVEALIPEPPPFVGAVLVRVYLRPRNPRMRLVERQDGSHARLWLKPNAHPMIGWRVWAKPIEGSMDDYELHGRYNARGTRVV